MTIKINRKNIKNTVYRLILNVLSFLNVIGIKDSNPPFNIFSLAVAHETDLPLTEKEKITANLIKLKADKSLKFGVFKRIVSIEDFLNIISYLVTLGSNED